MESPFAAKNLAAMLFRVAQARGTRPVFRAWRANGWQALSGNDFAAAAAGLARGLLARGVVAGDRVLIASENRPEVIIAELALMAIRAVPVPSYATNLAEDFAHILRDAGARAAIVSGPDLVARMHQAAALADGLDLLIAMDPAPGAVDFASVTGGGAPVRALAAEAEMIPPGALACLLYTSGTGGAPKGVMLPHRAILANCRAGAEFLGPLRPAGAVYLSFLPASHSFEHMVGLFLMPAMGAEVVFGRGIDQLARDLVEIAPNFITVVPRLLEVVRGRITGQMARAPRWQQSLFKQTLAIGLRRLDRRLRPTDRLIDPLLDYLVRKPIRARFGGQLRAAVSGGARLDPELGRFFLALGVRVLQGYGQTEAGPAIAANPPNAARPETVGPPLSGVLVRLAPDGEVLVHGACVMDGYWNQPAASAAALRDGWLATGDIGILEADGYLRITDRKKDIIKLSGGETISPARLEAILTGQPEIAQAVVAGDGQSAVSALLVAAEGVDTAAVARALVRANNKLAPPERIRRHFLVPAFTQQNGLMTANQKIRRKAVIARHDQLLSIETG